MNRTAHLVLLALAALLLCTRSALAQRPAVPQQPQQPPAPKTVTLDLKSVPLDEAIRRVVAATDVSVVIAGTLPKEPRVTMRLANADPVATLALLATTGGLQFQTSSGMGAYRHGPVPDGPTQDVVLIAAVAPEMPGTVGPRGPRPAPAAPEASAPPLTGAPIATNVAVDLNVKDVPFREAIDQIAKQIPPTSLVRIVVDDSVPKDLRVTARLSKMPLNWVIDSLVQQAGLTYGVQDEPDPSIVANLQGRYNAGVLGQPEMLQELAKAPRLHTVYIVPRPELDVSGSAGG